MPIKLTTLAECDLMEAQDFYAPKGAWVLTHFMNSINEAFSSLEKFAGIHPHHYGHYCMPVPHFPFSIYYDIEDAIVIVKAVLDNRFGPARISAHFGPIQIMKNGLRKDEVPHPVSDEVTE